MSKRGLLLLFIVGTLSAFFVIYRIYGRPVVQGGDGVASSEASRIQEKMNEEKEAEHLPNSSQSLQASQQFGEPTKNVGDSQGQIENDKLKPLSLAKQVSLIERQYPPALNKRGFTEHETEVIVRFQVAEMRSTEKNATSAIDKATNVLGLSAERKERLNEAFDEVFLGLVEFTVDDVATCMSRRLTKISGCTRSVLDDYLRDLSLALDTDVFEQNSKVTEITQSATKKAIETCKETPDRAEYQFRLVFVECDPI